MAVKMNSSAITKDKGANAFAVETGLIISVYRFALRNQSANAQ